MKWYWTNEKFKSLVYAVLLVLLICAAFWLAFVFSF